MTKLARDAAGRFRRSQTAERPRLTSLRPIFNLPEDGYGNWLEFIHAKDRDGCEFLQFSINGEEFLATRDDLNSLIEHLGNVIKECPHTDRDTGAKPYCLNCGVALTGVTP